MEESAFLNAPGTGYRSMEAGGAEETPATVKRCDYLCQWQWQPARGAGAFFLPRAEIDAGSTIKELTGLSELGSATSPTARHSLEAPRRRTCRRPSQKPLALIGCLHGSMMAMAIGLPLRLNGPIECPTKRLVERLIRGLDLRCGQQRALGAWIG